MGFLGFDSDRPLSGAAVAAFGGEFVMRYVGIPGNPKCILRPELDDLVAHGVQVGFVFESTAGRAGEGHTAGFDDARAACDYLTALDIPFPQPVFFAVDYDADPAVLTSYFVGLSSLSTIMPTGVYGSFRVVEYLINNGFVTFGWQTAAWSQGEISDHAQLYQHVDQIRIGGINCDINTSFALDNMLDKWAYPRRDFLMALEDWQQQRMFEHVMSMSEGVTGQSDAGEQFLNEQQQRDALNAKIDALTLSINEQIKALNDKLDTKNLSGTVMVTPGSTITIHVENTPQNVVPK